MHTLVIRGGTVVDGTGAAAFTADVAVDGGVITEVGRVGGRGRREIDATGMLVTPGFVDPHTHYDGQATWDPLLAPSSWHGVTTLVMGNCGVGFAPVRPDRRAWLVELMEGVEDIPGTALHDGIDWSWESFPEYLDALDAMPRAIDVAAQVPHGALRAYVMGDRAVTPAAPTADDLATMERLVRDSLRAGAVGVSTNRLPMHTALDGTPVPGTFADEAELLAITRPLAELGVGALEVVPAGSMGEDLDAPARELALFERLARATGRPVTFTLVQVQNAPEQWRGLLQATVDAVRDGAMLVPQVQTRPLGLLLGLQAKNVLTGRPSYDEVAHLPLPERVERLHDPDRRSRILGEHAAGNGLAALVERISGRVYRMGSPPDYEPAPEASVESIAASRGVPTMEALYDLLLEDGGRAFLLFAMGGYADGNLDAIGSMLASPVTVVGLGDGGAHCGILCDASTTTYALTHWVRDRPAGRLPLEEAVRKMTSATAQLYGLADRGVVAPGLRADFNVVDLDALGLHMPELVTDLPGGASRLVQRSTGYRATIVAGEPVTVDGEDTGARPGRLVRGPQRPA